MDPRERKEGAPSSRSGPVLLAGLVLSCGASAVLAGIVIAQRARLNRGEALGLELREALFSAARLAEGQAKATTVPGSAAATDAQPGSLDCYLEMLDVAARHENEGAAALALVPIVGAMGDVERPYADIPGGLEAVKARLPVLRRLLASENASIRFFAANVVVAVGEKEDLAALGRAVDEIPLGRLLLASAEKRLGGDESAGLRAIAKSLESGDDLDRTIALNLLCLVTVCEDDRSVGKLLLSDSPEERAEGLKHLEDLAGEPVNVDPAELRDWLADFVAEKEVERAAAEGNE